MHDRAVLCVRRVMRAASQGPRFKGGCRGLSRADLNWSHRSRLDIRVHEDVSCTARGSLVFPVSVSPARMFADVPGSAVPVTPQAFHLEQPSVRRGLDSRVVLLYTSAFYVRHLSLRVTGIRSETHCAALRDRGSSISIATEPCACGCAWTPPGSISTSRKSTRPSAIRVTEHSILPHWSETTISRAQPRWRTRTRPSRSTTRPGGQA